MRILFASLLFLATPLPAFAAFSDVLAQDPDAASIGIAQGRGIMTGVTETSFEPDRTVTRAELVKIALEIDKSPVRDFLDGEDAPFPDVPRTHSLARYIRAASQEPRDTTAGPRALQGYDDGTFRPDQPVSFAEASKMLLALTGGKSWDNRLSYFFTAANADSVLAGYYNVAAQQNLFGWSYGEYRANVSRPAKRRDVARAVTRMLQLRDAAASGRALFRCNGADAFDLKTLDRWMGDAFDRARADYGLHDICVSDELKIGMALYRPIGDSRWSPLPDDVALYTFRMDSDRAILLGESGGRNCRMGTRNGAEMILNCNPPSFGWQEPPYLPLNAAYPIRYNFITHQSDDGWVTQKKLLLRSTFIYERVGPFSTMWGEQERENGSGTMSTGIFVPILSLRGQELLPEIIVSPDKTRAAFTLWNGRSTEIYVQDFFGKPFRITSAFNYDAGSLRWRNTESIDYSTGGGEMQVYDSVPPPGRQGWEL
jgi:hypothetical protein